VSKLVAAMAVAHVPGHTINPDMVPADQMQRIRRAWDELQRKLADAQPDVVIAVSNDHFQNFFPVQPPFCLGSGDKHLMPAAARAAPLKLPSREIAGSPSFAEHLLKTADACGLPLAFSDELLFSDEISIPQRFLDPDNRFKWLPILTNCLNRNRPSPRSFFKLGEVIAAAIDRADQEMRVAVVVTGGLSHDPFGPRWCLIDEGFDRRFLELVEAGALDTLFDEFPLQRILEPGKGGTPEILNWFVGLGAVGRGRRAEILCYEPVPVWATGVGYAHWLL
jgi:aromatic ring-opening dioxygenase catalytic subunit (LigB family)